MRSNPATVVIVLGVGMLLKKTWRVYLVLALLTMAVLLWESPTWAQSYRYGLPRSSVEMNGMLLTYARGNRFESIEALLPLYEPLFNAFKTKFAQDVKSEMATALASRNGPALRRSVHHLVQLDMMDFLDLVKNSLKESPQKAQFWLRAAQFDYSLLSPIVQNGHLGSDQEIWSLFREAAQMIDDGSIDLLGPVLDKISTELNAGLKKYE